MDARFIMKRPFYIYGIDDHPPIIHSLLYALQWAVILFPALIVVATLGGKALGLAPQGEVRFLQMTLLTTGLFTAVQCFWGHRYPLLDGPSAALLLTFIVLAPLGIEVIQGGTLLGGFLLMAFVLTGQFSKVVKLATPNVVGVILMLISFTLLPHLTRTMMGVDALHPEGQPLIFYLSMLLVMVMAMLSHWLKGFLKTIALLFGMIGGALAFHFLTTPDWDRLIHAGWFDMPSPWMPGSPVFYWPAVIALATSYIAVVVNSLGSINGIAAITDTDRLSGGLSRGVFLNGLGGVLCGIFGTVGLATYSMSPGVILANRVASRYATAYCGVLFVVAAFVPKVAALLAAVPSPVVGAALCVAMGAQVGAALAIVASRGLTSRDYYVVGLPVIIGTLVGFLPESFLDEVSPGLRVFLGNGLIVGIALVLLLEHVLMRRTADRP